MDLKDFVAQTLTQIVEGVKEAQGAIRPHGAVINPRFRGIPDGEGLIQTPSGASQVVQFDVALSVKEGTATKGGIGVLTGMINLGSAGQSNAENSSLSRVKFLVPLVLPPDQASAP